MSTVIRFPGQGVQRPGMLDALHDHPAVRRTRQEARSRLSALGRPSDIDSERARRDTIGTQLGATSFVETPPGHVLTRLTHAAAPAAVAVALADSDFPAAALRLELRSEKVAAGFTVALALELSALLIEILHRADSEVLTRERAHRRCRPGATRTAPTRCRSRAGARLRSQCA